MTAMTASQADTALDQITAWLRGHQDITDLIEAAGTAQATIVGLLDEEVPQSERQAMRLLYCDHLWCTLDAALADEIAHRRGRYGQRVEDARRAAGRKPIPRDLVTLAATYVPDAIRAMVRPAPTPGQFTTALRILAVIICPTPRTTRTSSTAPWR